MNNKSFDDIRIAEGYAKDRPYLHPQVIEMVQKDLELCYKLENGLDAGCGAGLSAKALKEICERVIGTDISPEMIRAARQMCGEAGFIFYTCKAEETADMIMRAASQKGQGDAAHMAGASQTAELFDIVTAAGVVNWVDRQAFPASMNRLLKDGGYLVIYDFWITDRMQGSAAYTRWWNGQYLPKFPKPFRREDRWDDKDLGPFGFKVREQKDIELTWRFDMETFINFMMIQSNVNEQIEKHVISEEETRNWFRKTLNNIFLGGIKTLQFDGYVWYIQKTSKTAL